jgi:hypothetical protein
MIRPDGWTRETQGNDRVVFRDPTGRHQTTLAILALHAPPTFEEFTMLCEHRLDAERAESSHAFIEGGVPLNERGRFVCIYSGGNRESRRMFCGYLTASDQKFISLYVGIGISTKDQVDTFSFFAEQAMQEFK